MESDKHGREDTEVGSLDWEVGKVLPMQWHPLGEVPSLNEEKGLLLLV